MEIKILQVFLGADGLPYKDQARTVHYPITGSGFQNANNTTQIRFYFSQLSGENTTWVAVSKIPNGRIGSKVLETYDDDEINEPYALLELDSFYTQYKGDVFISLQGYQNGVQVTYDAETEIYTITGTPTIASTGSIKFTNNYSPSFVGSGEEENVTLQQLLGALSQKTDVNNAIFVLNNISTSDLSGYLTGQLFYDKTTNLYYKKIATSPYYELADKGILGESKVLYRVEIDSSTTIEDLEDLTDNYTRLLVAKYQSQDYLLGISKIGELYNLVIIMFNYGFNDPLVIFKGGTLDNTQTVVSFISNTNQVVYVKQTNSGEKVYGTNELGAQSIYDIDSDLVGSGAIVRRESGTGTVIVGTPTAVNHATTKSYVDSGFVQHRSQSGNNAYVNVGGTDTLMKVTSNAEGGIMSRNSSGQTKVGDPTDNEHAANKGYVDSKVAALGTVLNYKGTKTVAELNALTGQVAGDIYNVLDAGTLNAGSITVLAGDNVVWTSNSVWDKLAGTVDLSGYCTKDYVAENYSTKTDTEIVVDALKEIASGDNGAIKEYLECKIGVVRGAGDGFNLDNIDTRTTNSCVCNKYFSNSNNSKVYFDDTVYKALITWFDGDYECLSSTAWKASSPVTVKDANASYIYGVVELRRLDNATLTEDGIVNIAYFNKEIIENKLASKDYVRDYVNETKGENMALYLPETFANSNIPSIYYSGGKAVCNLPNSEYIYSTKVYVDKDNGNDTTGDGTQENPYKTIKKSITNISSDTTIYVKSTTPFLRGEHFNGGSIGTTYKLSFVNNNSDKKPILLTTGASGLTWTQEDNVWKTTRSATTQVLHKDSRDFLFGWRKVPHAADLATCKATPGTYFISGTTVYVNTYNGLVPTESTYILTVISSETTFYVDNNITLSFDGFGFVCADRDAVLFTTYSSNNVQGKIALFNCVAGLNDMEEGGTTGGNGFAFQRVKEVYLFNCYAKNVRRDGFNYHYENPTSLPDDRIVFEYNCKAVDCGLNETTTNNNGSTAHDATKIIRVNTECANTKGPLIADVGGCISYCIGCKTTKIDYSNYGGFVFQMNNTGSAYLINSKTNDQILGSDGIIYLSDCEYSSIQSGTVTERL